MVPKPTKGGHRTRVSSYAAGAGPTHLRTRVTIVRLGSMNPRSAPRNHPSGAVPAGRISILSYDDQAQNVRLEDFWSLDWRQDGAPPASTPT